MNPSGNMAWVELEQRLNGIPVFQGYLRGAFTAKGELARTSGRLAAGVAAAALDAAPSITAAQAIALAAASVGLPASEQSLAPQGTVNGHQVFARGAMAAAPEAWLVYFPIAHGVARLAWATQVFGDPLSFMTVVDAETGTLLFRKNLTDFQTQAATYNVYTSDSPAPSSPSPALPGANYVAPVVPRENRSRIGNEPPYTLTTSAGSPTAPTAATDTRTATTWKPASISRRPTVSMPWWPARDARSTSPTTRRPAIRRLATRRRCPPTGTAK